MYVEDLKQQHHNRSSPLLVCQKHLARTIAGTLSGRPEHSKLVDALVGENS